MSEGESIIEAKERLTGEELIEEIKAGAREKQLLWENAEAKSKGDQETKKNIAENAQNFWRFFNKIPAEDYPQLDTPEKFIEALNQKGGSFAKTGEKVRLNDVNYKIYEISPCSILKNSKKLEEMIAFCNTGKYSMLTGTNFWDNPPQEGRLFIPAIYLVEREN